MEISESRPAVTLPRAAERADRTRQRLRLQRIRKALLALALAAACAAVVFALLPKPVPADFAAVTRGPLTVEVRETGQTRVKDRYVVSAPVTGHLLRLALEPNDAASEGAPLAQIAPSSAPLLDARARAEAEARLAAALSALEHADVQRAISQTAREQAEHELTRARKLERAGSLPGRTLE